MILPPARQVEHRNWERGLFLYFVLRPFYDGFRDVDRRTMTPGRFYPSRLDCDSWMEIARGAGFTYAVLTGKHLDGFAL